MRFQLFCGALLGLVFRWSNPLIAKTATLVLILTVVEGFTRFIQHRRRFSRLVASHFLFGLILARSASQSPLGAYEIHWGAGGEGRQQTCNIQRNGKGLCHRGRHVVCGFLPSYAHLIVLIHGQSLNLFASFLVCFFTSKAHRRRDNRVQSPDDR
jgi:hypothetical protein